MALIGFERKAKQHDPNIAPISGRRGSCALCGHFSQLTETHILPRSAGNLRDLLAHSYLASSSGADEELLARRFKNGISFWTLCRDCNSSLGSNEDREIAHLYDRVLGDLNRGVILPSPLRYVVRPNKLMKGILAHIASANDPGTRTAFEKEVQEIFQGKKHIRDTRLRIYYWPYLGRYQTIIRDVSVSYNFFKDPIFMQVIKMRPLGFAVTDSQMLFGRPCLNMYRTDRDAEEYEIPLFLEHQENHPHWPATPGNNGAAMFSSKSMGVIAKPR